MSMIVVLGRPERIVAACDSRRWMRDDATDAPLEYHDDCRKLELSADRLVLAHTGAVSVDLPAVWASLPSVRGSTARARLDRLVRAVEAGSGPIGPAVLEARVAVFRYAGARPDGAVVRLRQIRGGRPAVVERGAVERIPFVSLLGYDELGFLFGAVGGQLTAAVQQPLTEARIVVLARTAIEDAAGTSNLLGGFVHLIVLDGAGGRWVAGGER